MTALFTFSAITLQQSSAFAKLDVTNVVSIVIFSKERVVRVILLNTQFSVLLTVYFTYTRLFRYSPSQHLCVFSINRLCDVGEFRKVGNTSL